MPSVPGVAPVREAQRQREEEKKKLSLNNNLKLSFSHRNRAWLLTTSVVVLQSVCVFYGFCCYYHGVTWMGGLSSSKHRGRCDTFSYRRHHDNASFVHNKNYVFCLNSNEKKFG